MTPRFGSLTETLLSRCQQLAQECEDITLVFDGGNTSRANLEALQASPLVTQHEDLLAVPQSRFHSFDDPRLAGVTAYRSSRRSGVSAVRWWSPTVAGYGKARSPGSTTRCARSALHCARTKLARSQQPGAKGKGYSRASLQHFDAITSGQYAQILKIQISESDGALSFRFRTDWARTSACNAGVWASASCAPTTTRGATKRSS